MKKFLVFLVAIIVVVSFGLTTYYFLRNDEVIRIETKEIFCNAAALFPSVISRIRHHINELHLYARIGVCVYLEGEEADSVIFRAQLVKRIGLGGDPELHLSRRIGIRLKKLIFSVCVYYRIIGAGGGYVTSGCV